MYFVSSPMFSAATEYSSESCLTSILYPVTIGPSFSAGSFHEIISSVGESSSTERLVGLFGTICCGGGADDSVGVAVASFEGSLSPTELMAKIL